MPALPVDDRGHLGPNDAFGYRVCGNVDYRVDLVSLACIDDFDPRSVRQNQRPTVTRLTSASGIEYGPIELDPAVIRDNNVRSALAKVSVALI